MKITRKASPTSTEGNPKVVWKYKNKGVHSRRRNKLFWGDCWSLQGDTLAPSLFAIVLDYVMCQTYSGRENEIGFQLQRQRSPTITDFYFADDIALLTQEIQQTHKVLSRLEAEAQKAKLYCNDKKTELTNLQFWYPCCDGHSLKVVNL